MSSATFVAGAALMNDSTESSRAVDADVAATKTPTPAGRGPLLRRLVYIDNPRVLLTLLVVIGGGDHRDLALGFGPGGDAVEEPSSQEPPIAGAGLGALAAAGLGRESCHRSKTPRRLEGCGSQPTSILPIDGGFSSISRAADPGRP
jgi:hypothetical protein